MPVYRNSTPSPWPRHITIGVLLALLGLLGNYTSLPLLFGIDFIFGSIASMLALALLGPIAAILVAAIASAYTLVLWNHPYAIVIFTAEVAFVAACYHRRPQMNLVLADAAYWLVMGIPLVLFFYQNFLKLGFDQALFIGTKQAMNGVFNLLCANLIVLLARSRNLRLVRASHFCPITIRNVTFNLVLGVVLLVGVLPIVINQHQTGRLLESDLNSELAATATMLLNSEHTANSPEALEKWLDDLPAHTALHIYMSHNGQEFYRGEFPPLDRFEAVPTSHSHLTLYKDAREKSAIQRWNKGLYVHHQTVDGWTVQVGKSASELVAKLQTAKQNAFLILNLLLVLAIALSQLLCRVVEAPLVKLRQLTHLIGADHKATDATVTPSQIHEFKLLFEAFSDMSQRLAHSLNQLKENNDSLESRVEKRTQDIQRLSTVASTTTNGVAIMDEDGNIVWTNRAFHNILAKDNNRIWGQGFESFLRIKDTEQHSKFSKKIRDEDRFSIVFQVLNDRHQHLWISLEWIKTNTVDHGHNGYIALITDITAEKDAATELANYAARLEDINAEQEKARQAAENAARIKAEFLASMSHEIRTPLNGVVGMLGLLQRSEQTEQQTHYTRLALRSAESLLNTVNEILDFSKIEAGQLKLEEVEFDLAKMLSEFAVSNALRAQEKGIDLYLDVTKLTHTHLRSDPSRILQILNNLIGNAIKFTEQGFVQLNAHLSAQSDGTTILECAVIDTGIGIEAEVLPDLFNAFTQADASTTRKYGGTGLGLAITKQLCELLGGTLNVASTPGQGSQFVVQLPVQLAQENAGMAERWPDLSAKTIVVVDSHEHQRRLTLNYLMHTGATLTELRTLDEISMDDPDWLIIGPESIKALETARAAGRLSQCRTLVLCSHAKRADLLSVGQWVNFRHLPTPLTALSGQDFAPELRAHANGSAVNSAPGKKHYVGRLLLVEDNHVNQELARTLLEDMGYHVSMAGNGAEALDHLIDTPRQDAFDLILMDCQMPEMDGYTATRFIRNGKAGKLNADIPIIAMTANAMKGDREQCLAAGMNDYLSKPLDFDVVERTLGQWLARKQGNGQLETSPTATTSISEPAAEEEAIEIPVWDKEDALKRVRQREDRLVSLVELFVRDMPTRCEKIETLVAENNVTDVQRVAHEVKGVAGNISAKALFNSARDLEIACKERRAIRTQFKKLKAEMEKIQHILTTYLEEQKQRA